jgi:tetratricopeptide (TPR) repeat protein
MLTLEEAATPNRKTVAAATLLLVLVLAAYLPALRKGFLYDDFLLILKPAVPRSAADIAKLFARPYYEGLPYYRPVTSASFLVQRRVWGDDPRPFHAANVALAGALAVLTYGLFRRPCFGLAPGMAAAGAAIFILHPVVSSCVHPVSGRDTLLATSSMVAAVWIYLRGTVGAAIASAAVFAAGLLCKEAAIVTPGVIALAEAAGLSRPAGAPRRSATALATRAAPFLVVLAAYAAVRAVVLPGGQMSTGTPGYVPLTYVYALEVTLTPFRALLYEPPVAAWLSPSKLVVVGLVLALAALTAWRSGRGVRSVLVFGIGWFVVVQLPTANLVRQETLFDERYVAPAVLGLVLAGAALASEIARRAARERTVLVAAALLALALGALSRSRAPYFDEVAFYTQWAMIRPDSMTARFNLANAYAKTGRPGRAVEEYERALAIEPSHAGAHNNLGEAFIKLGRRDEAIAQFREAIRYDPNNVKAHNNLGSGLALGGDMDGAIAEFREAVRLDPGYVGAIFDLGYALLLEGANEEAIERLQEVLRRDPSYEKAHRPLGIALLRRGRKQEAVVELTAAARFSPGDVELQRLLATAEAGEAPR